MRFGVRRPALPNPVVRAAGGERVLEVAVAADGTWVAGTRAHLFVVPADQQARRLPWERLRRADWDSEASTLRCEPVEDYGQPVVRLVLVLADEPDPAGLLDLVRERVTASLLLQRRVLVSGRRGLTVVGRRSPVGGEVVWAYELDPGIDPADPLVMTAAELGLREAQESLGL